MNITAEELKLMSHSILMDKYGRDFSVKYHWDEYMTIGHRVNEIMDAVPETLTSDALRAQPNLLMEAVRNRVYETLRAEITLVHLTNDAIKDAIDDASVAEIAQEELPFTLFLLDLLAQLRLATALVDFNENIDDELRTLMS